MTTRTSEARLAAWDAKVRWPIIVAAVAPIALALTPLNAESPLVIATDLVSWAVFLVDLVVRIALDRQYLRSGAGLFDLSIVVFTFPWYIFPRVEGTQFLAVFRLARLLRLVTATGAGTKLRYLYDSMGALLITVTVGLFVAAVVVRQAEPPSSGFDTFGDAVWWGVVTLTTVGYGDLVPTTPPGRLAGFMVMMLGLAVVGTLAGVLASMFGGAADEPNPDATTPEQLASQLDRVEERLDHLESLLGEVNDRLSRPGS
jgi:voltage-gated potassium channel